MDRKNITKPGEVWVLRTWTRILVHLQPLKLRYTGTLNFLDPKMWKATFIRIVKRHVLHTTITIVIEYLEWKFNIFTSGDDIRKDCFFWCDYRHYISVQELP